MIHTTRALRYLSTFCAILFAVAGCRVYGKYDSTARAEDKACLVPEELHAVEPPLVEPFAGQGITIDYARLVPRPNPRKGVDMDYARTIQGDSQAVEQVYYDASQGNERARWLVCIYEVAARFMGREAARYLASLKCQTAVNCSVNFDALPFSEDTASGMRLLSQVGKAFDDQAKSAGLKQDLIANGLTLLIGVRAASNIRTGGTAPPRTNARPPDRVAKQPYDPHVQRAELEAANPGKVKSSTVPRPEHPNVKLAGQRHPVTNIVYDQRGFPIFDDIAIFETRLARNAWIDKSSKAHMQAATRDLRTAIRNGRVSRSKFTPEQQKAIEAGEAKIPGYTWHHHQDPGRMQLIPSEYHKQSAHVGGHRLWKDAK